MKTGVYKITNIINKQCYVGISLNIFKRWNTHINNVYNDNCPESDKALYKAMRKYGIENFTFQIIEFCSENELQQKEIQWINHFNSYKDGYNETVGGDIGGFERGGDLHPNHKLTIEDVVDIRMRYGKLERKKTVYELYRNKIGKSGFDKIWNGETWKNVMMEVYTKENKQHHKINTGNLGATNGRALLTVEQVKDIRQRKRNGESIKTVLHDYKDVVSQKYLYNVWNEYTWKEI
jgi:group I intron endonuclease